MLEEAPIWEVRGVDMDEKIFSSTFPVRYLCDFGIVLLHVMGRLVALEFYSTGNASYNVYTNW